MAPLALSLALLSSVAPLRAQSDDEARGLYSAGVAAFSAGRYEDALGYFQRAYELSHRAHMLYNIGHAADRARRDEIALDAFERYLAGVADIENRAEIEGRIRVLRAAVAERQARTAPLDPPPDITDPDPPSVDIPTVAPPRVETVTVDPPRDDASGPIDPGAVVLVTTGGVLAIAGAIMVGVGAPDIDGPREGEIYATGVARQERATILVGVGSPMIGLGVIGVVVGAVMLATTRPATPYAGRILPTADGLAVQF